MITINIDSDFVGEGVTWIDNTISYIGERSKKYLKEIATKIKTDIRDNVLQSRSINGGRVADNLKNKYGKYPKGFNRPLFHTGALANAISERAITGGYEVFISSDENRDKIGAILHFGYPQNNLIARPFFGISESTDNDIDVILGNPL